MATVDELIVQIKADTRDLNRKLGQLEGQVAKASNTRGPRQLGASLSSLKGPAIAAAAAIAGIGAATAGIVKVGAAFENLKISLNTVFGSASQGQAAFDRIRDFAKTSPFQVRDLSKAFIQLKSAGIEPTAKQMTLFSDAASVTTDSLGAFEALVRITQRSVGGGLGLEELEQLSDRGIPVYEILAEKLGVTRQEISDIGQEAAGAADIMKALGEGLEERFGGATAAKMDTVNQKFSTLGDNLDGLALAFFEEGGIGGGLKSALDTLNAMVNRATVFVKVLATGLPAEFFNATTPQEQLEVLRPELEKRQATLSTSSGRMKEGAQRRVDEVAIVIEGIEKEIQKTKELIQQQKRDEQVRKENAAARKQERIETEKINETHERYKDLVESTIPETREFQAAIDGMQAIADSGDQDLITKIFGDENTVEVMANLREQLKEMQDPVKETAKLFNDEMVQAIVSTSHAFTNDFVNALLDGQNVLDSFKNFAKKIVAQIIATFLQLAVVNRILNAVFQNFEGYEMQPTILGGSSPSQKASGGTYGPNRPMLVGERGPELMIPNSGGRVMNAHSSRMAMGGGGVVINQNLNFSTGVVPTVRSEVMKMLPTISDVTKASVLEAASRGGSYQRGLLGV